jgi:hypothetical protein
VKKITALAMSLFLFAFIALGDSWLYLNITATGTFSVKTGNGVFHTLTVNTAGVSSVITIFDLGGTASTVPCTGTPSTRKIATITLPASGVLPGTLLYDISFQQGLCVLVATAASDLTVAYQ